MAVDSTPRRVNKNYGSFKVIVYYFYRYFFFGSNTCINTSKVLLEVEYGFLSECGEQIDVEANPPYHINGLGKHVEYTGSSPHLVNGLRIFKDRILEDTKNRVWEF